MINLRCDDEVVSAVSHVGYIIIVTKFGDIFRVANAGNIGLAEVIRL